MNDDDQESHNATMDNSFRNSCKLWPDPFDAPDVPPKEVFTRLVTDLFSLDQDLRDQIAESVNCQRALEVLHFTQARPDSAAEDDFLHRLAESIELSPPEATSSTALSPFADTAPQPGLLCSTTNRVEYWNGRKIVSRWTWFPLSALIMESGRPGVGGDTLFSAAPCTPEAFWPEEWRSDDEVIADFGPRGRWIVHRWLEHTLSEAQIETALGAIADPVIDLNERLSLDHLEPAGEPLHHVLNQEALLERDRLRARAAYLGANARAREAAAGADAVISDLATFQKLAMRIVLPMARAAADGEYSSRLAVATETEFQAVRMGIQEKVRIAAPSRGQGQAIVRNHPEQDRTHPAKGFVQWHLDPPQPRGRRVFVVDPEGEVFLGEGKLSDDGRIATLNSAPWADLQRYVDDPLRLNDLAILVVTDE